MSNIGFWSHLQILRAKPYFKYIYRRKNILQSYVWVEICLCRLRLHIHIHLPRNLTRTSYILTSMAPGALAPLERTSKQNKNNDCLLDVNCFHFRLSWPSRCLTYASLLSSDQRSSISVVHQWTPHACTYTSS